MPIDVAYSLFGLFALSWLIAAVWTARTAQRPRFGSETLYRVLTFLGFAMLITGVSWQGGGLLPMSIQWMLVLVEAAGFAFCWWARLHLGAMWSASVTRKEDHRIIDTGPYGLVRHPIYTGLIASGFALGLINGQPQSLLGAVILCIAWVIKAGLEERFLRQELGAEAYGAYAARVPMIVPFAPR